MNGPIGIVCGSGIELEGLLDSVVEERPFSAMAELPSQGVAGHALKFVLGACGAFHVVLQCGRLHFYEGLDYETVVHPVDILHELGVRTVVFTNAAGGLKPGMQPGDLVAIERVRLWRYRPWAVSPGMLFPDFVVPDCDFLGTYQWMHGPAYETRAEIATLQNLGTEAVGMSTAPELMRCHELGMRAAILCCITNSCCVRQRLHHQHVLDAARKASGKIVRLLRRSLPKLANHSP
jgi:purine-nucleoside phosphorylase